MCIAVTDITPTTPTTPLSATAHLPPPLPAFPVPHFSGPVGGRLHHFWRNWLTIGADEWVVSVLRDGYYLPFSDDIPPLMSDPPHLSYHESHPLFQELAQQIESLLLKQAIEEVHNPTPGFYSRLFLAPKKTGDWRPVIDLSLLNTYLISPHFRMETPASILRSMVDGAWTSSLDLKDAFFHVPVARAHRKFLRFRFGHRHFHFRALPFGLTTSPYLFTRLVKPVGAYARSRGLSITQYLDDWLLSAASPQSCNEWTQWLLQLTTSLGLVVNLPKSDLTPKQVFDYIGITFDLSNGLACPAHHRVQTFLNLLKSFTQSPAPPAVRWQQVLGHMTSLEKLTRRGRLHMRPLQFALHDFWNQLRDPPLQPIPITPEVRSALEWWSHQPNLTSGVPLHQPPPQLQLFTDASTEGWGAHLDLQQVAGQWTPEQRHLHINILELLAVRLALQHFQQQVANHSVVIMTDNSTVVAQIRNQGGTHSRQLHRQTALLLSWADNHSVHLLPRHIPGRLNVLADQLSRRHQVLNTEWTLAQPVLTHLWHLWGRPHVDMFATANNARLPVFVSPLPDPQAWRVDAFSFPWENLDMYLYPPTQLIGEVLHRIQLVSCRAILIAPAWPTQYWFPLLLSLVVDHPRRLPTIRTLLRQPHTGQFHPDPQRLALHAWLLSSPPSSDAATQRQWLGELPLPTDSLPKWCTTASGESSQNGAGTLTSIHSLPLHLS